MDYRAIERDFIKRTLAILEQYDEFKDKLPEPSQYEVTLLINSLLGLLLFPQQLASDEKNGRFKDWLTDKKFIEVADEWSLKREYISSLGMKEENKPYEWPTFTIRNLVRSMRNAAAHKGFKVTSFNDRITHINFKNDGGFRMSLPVESLRDFVRKLAESALGRLG